MAKRIVIRFPADRPYEYYTDVFHFAEAVWAPIVRGGLGTLNDIDRAREVIWVELAATRFAGDVKEIVKRALKKHRLLEEATITTE